MWYKGFARLVPGDKICNNLGGKTAIGGLFIFDKICGLLGLYQYFFFCIKYHIN